MSSDCIICKKQIMSSKNTTYCSRECYLSTIRTHHKVDSICAFCGKNIVVDSMALKKNKSGKCFCDKSCSMSYKHKHNGKRVLKPCAFCGKILEKTKHHIDNLKFGNIFCNKKCSSRFRQSLKRKPKICKKCNLPFTTFIDDNGKSHSISARIYCFECSPFGSNGLGVPKESKEKIVRQKRIKKENIFLFCKFCNKEFVQQKGKNVYCSRKCLVNDNYIPRILINCDFCGKQVTRKQRTLKPNKIGKFFCGKSCSAFYGNLHRVKKRFGCRVSKIEKYIQKQLLECFPTIQFLFNDSSLVNGELDIYIPELSLAFEINGAFHYEPIFGEEKLKKIQDNDDRKYNACIEKGIQINVLDITYIKTFSVDRMQVVADKIIDSINRRLSSLNNPDRT